MTTKKEILKYCNYLAECGKNDSEIIEIASNDLKVPRSIVHKIMFGYC